MSSPLRRRRLLYLAVYDPHVPYTGTGARGGEFVNFLARHDELDLVYMEGSGHPGDPDLEAKFADRIQGVRHKIRIPFTSWDYFIFSPTLLQKAEAFLRTEKYDYILADYGLAARYGIALSKKSGVPFVYSSHNIEYRQYLGKARKDFRRWPLVPYVRRVERRGCEEALLVVAISEEDATFYTRWIPRDKIVIVPQGFDENVLNPFYPPPSNDPFIVLFFGNYNISTNREAVQVVRDCIVDEVVSRVPNVLFRFVGANPPTELIHPNFEFTGFVDSIVDQIKNADVIISPMLGGWGMPTKVVESLACGKPVVATEIGARSVPRTYKQLTVENVEAFSGRICEVLEAGNSVDASDFEKLKQDFLWENQLVRFRRLLDESLRSVTTKRNRRNPAEGSRSK